MHSHDYKELEQIRGKSLVVGIGNSAVDIACEAAKNRRRYQQSARHTLQVDFHPYKQSIERGMNVMGV